jgi:D-alanyl-D-alanine endopeptidase (penicillin-binding protein 7)
LSVDVGVRTENYRNTNRLVDRADWEIGLQKTGFISEAGNCLVMQARIDDRSLVVVLLDARGSVARMGDANRIRHWVEQMPAPAVQRVSQPPEPHEPAPGAPRDATRT